MAAVHVDAEVVPEGGAAILPAVCQRHRDLEHLRLLSFFHYVYAGLSLLMALLPLVHVALGIAILAGAMSPSGKNPPSPQAVGLLFIFAGGLFSLFGWASMLAAFFAGRFLARKKHRIFCMVVGGIWCIFFPYGTLLGIFTLLVLNRPSVQALFDTPVATAVRE